MNVLRPLVAFWALAASAVAQSPSPPPAAPAPTPVASAMVVAVTEKDAAELDQIEAERGADAVATDAKARIGALQGKLAALEAETDRQERSSGSVVSLQGDGAGWAALKEEVAGEKRLLAAAVTRLDARKQGLDEIAARWAATRSSPEGAKLPPDVLRRLDGLQARIGTARKGLDDQLKAILSQQSRLAENDARIGKILAAVAQARNAARDRLFVQDSPPMWEAALAARPAEGGTAGGAELAAQGRALLAYASRERGPVALQIAIWLVAVAAFRWAGRHTRAWVEAEPKLRHSTRVFEVPMAAATLLALACTPLLHPTGPRALFALAGALLVIPLLVVVRRLIERSLMPLTWALALFYLAGLVRQATAAVPFLPRVVFLVEMIVAACFCLWLVKLSLFSAVPERGMPVRWRAVRAGAYLGLVAFALAAGANALGYFNLSVYVGRAVLVSAYLAVLLYVATRIAEGLVIFALNVPPASLLGMVRHHRPLLERRCTLGLRWVGFAAWVALSLDQLALWTPFVAATSRLLNETLRLGPYSAAAVLEFALTVWAAFLVSRFVRFALEEDIYRRVTLARGAAFAFSTLLHYSILFVGFYLAVTLLIGDMTRLTILAGAFTVGVGFGLQNIVNNFVSGIIVLFERPVKIGDVVQVGADVGEVRRIGVRATVIQTTDGAEIIVPNAKLISEPVTNWTLYDRQRAVEVVLTTPTTVDPARVIALLEQAARAHPAVSQKPAPRGELGKVGGGMFTFELHAWTDDIDGWRTLRSDLTIAISALLPQHGITIS